VKLPSIASFRLWLTAGSLLLLVACGAGREADDRGQAASIPLAANAALQAIATPIATPADTEIPTGQVLIEYTRPFIWPVLGPVTSFMGPEHPDGIDIALDADGSSASPVVRAAAAGAIAFAGGSDDEPLGISVVIDHGNGITTTYGHLDELSVEDGDEVALGDAIGVGGSTGVSTGRHLHFEVRKDGATVDPLTVLPGEVAATSSESVDCATTPFALPAGSRAQLNFASALDAGERVVSVRAMPLNGGPALQPGVESAREVRVASELSFDGPDREDRYALVITVDQATGNRVIECGFSVQHRSVSTVFYVRANPREGASEDQAPVEPTPTPVVQLQLPSYELPTTSNAGSQSPSYELPGGTSPAISAPSYAVPGGQ
jgi:hypothetical protein